MEEKESINENIPKEELEIASGGAGRRNGDLKRQKQERNREKQEAGFLRRRRFVD